MNIRDIHKGRERRRLELPLEVVGKFFRSGVTRERIRQIEASPQLSEAVATDYRAALAKILEIAQRYR